MPFCPECGTECSQNAKFCSVCGVQLAVNVSAPVRREQTQLKQRKTMPRSLIPVSVADLLPAMVRGQLAKLPAEQQAEFVEEFRRKRKSTGLAYLLWFIIGLHYVYLGKLGWQIFYWLTFGGFLIWMFIDIFRMPSMVRNYNRDVAVDVFRTLKIITSD